MTIYYFYFCNIMSIDNIGLSLYYIYKFGLVIKIQMLTTQCKILHYFRAQNGMKFFFKNIKFQVLEFENGSFRFVMVYFFYKILPTFLSGTLVKANSLDTLNYSSIVVVVTV